VVACMLICTTRSSKCEGIENRSMLYFLRLQAERDRRYMRRQT